MNRLLALFIAASGVAAATVVHADTFGGFSQDQSRYRTGRDKICTPIAAPGGPSRATPSCERADARRMAELKFRQGRKQQGAQADYTASFRGTELTIEARNPARKIVIWSALDPISRIVGIYASDDGGVVAVEYESRFAGRVRVETIAFAVPKPAAKPLDPAANAPAPGAGDTATGAGNTPAATPSATQLNPRAGKLLAKAKRHDKRGATRAAVKTYRQVLEIVPDHLEARYGLARSLARQGQFQAAVRELRTLANSGHPDAIIWLIEARFERAFARLRADAEFRAATGLDRDPAQSRGLYERLVGFSTTWEQSEVRCEREQAALQLARLARTFRLRITSRCGGYPETTRLSGRWTLAEKNEIRLTFPNPEGPDETLSCRLERCSGAEDCLRCGVDADLTFVLMPVRR